jgi:probable rRNA maturation factor
MQFEIDISNRQSVVQVDCSALRAAVVRTLEMELIRSAVLSVSIVDDATIHPINREHLAHDYPTDVLSFQLDFDPAEGASNSSLRAAGCGIEGEIIASAEMAASRASEGQWSVQDELTLFVIHGLLHICSYDDQSPEERRLMRSREQAIMNSLGRTAIYPP